MKNKILSLVAVMGLIGGAVFADVQLQNNGTNVGIVTKINVKGGTTSKSGQLGTVDMTSLSGINWSNVQGITSSAINWSNLQAASTNLAGINWSLASSQGDGINWYQAANGVTAATIVCWKANGQLGKCTTGVSAASCTACN